MPRVPRGSQSAPSNVADLVDPPRQARPEMKALTAEQARHVLAIARDDDFEALWILALTTGLRQGELLALKWPDVDLERGSLRVIASLVRILGQESILAEPKSRRSRRQVELADSAVDAIHRHKGTSIEAALAAGRSYDRAGFVFQREDGRPRSGTRIWKRWRALLKRAGVPHMPFHSARHTAASLLLGRGVHPKIASELLGYTTVAITLDVYSRVTPAMHREAARVMDDLLNG